MNIIVNGEQRELANNSSLIDLIETLGFAGKRLAIEVNLEIIPRSQYAACQLNNNDRVEIVHAIGGG